MRALLHVKNAVLTVPPVFIIILAVHHVNRDINWMQVVKRVYNAIRLIV